MLYVLNNHDLIHKALSINPLEILADGPFFQTKTARQKGCQIDYLIQTKHKTIYVCEIKFSNNVIGTNVISQVKEKLEHLSLPRGYIALPVLIHLGDLSQGITNSDYFFKTIDIATYLASNIE